jgi:cytidine kinase
MGYLARAGRVTAFELRRALAYGTVVASFNVEDFSLGRLQSATMEEIDARYAELRKMVRF